MVLEKTTSGPTGVGTRYREVVQMLPFFRGEILSEITHFEPDQRLEESFSGAGMRGHLAYRFVPEEDGTRLIQRETLHCVGLLRLIEPFIRRMLEPKLTERLESIKIEMEEG